MRHVEEALENMKENELSKYIKTHVENDGYGECVNVIFTIQSDPISEVGVNGCQARDMIEYVLRLIQSLDARFPCNENKKTITRLENALYWQDQRTKDRENRKVEGKNKA